MTQVALVTDSSSLVGGSAAVLGVDVVPVPVVVDGAPFAGPIDTFYERLRAGERATTSQPSPASFLAAYERAAARGADRVLSLHLDRRLSGVAASAELAAGEARLPVDVVDLPTVSYGVAVCVRAAHAALESGCGPEEAVEAARRAAATLSNLSAVRAAPGGRVSASQDWLVLRFADGEAEPLSQHATPAEAGDEIRRRAVAARARCAVAVGHADAAVEPEADALAYALRGEALVGSVERYRVEPSVGAHTGPDAFGVFWWTS